MSILKNICLLDLKLGLHLTLSKLAWNSIIFKVLIDSIYSISHEASFESSLHNAPSKVTLRVFAVSVVCILYKIIMILKADL